MQSTKHRVVTLIVTRSTDADNHLRIDVSLRQLIPHIRRALQICELLDEQKLAKHTLRASLDLLAPAVIIVDEHARLIDCNATANIMLQRQSGLRLSDNRVVPVLTGLEGTFAYAIARACVARPGEALPGSAVTLSGSDSHAIVAHIMPVATHATSPNQENNRSAAAIFIGGASLTAPAALDAVAATYRLTEGELRVLTQVANGESIAEAAAKLGITLATTRTHLKRIFAKLGVSRQAELVGLLNRIAPLRRQVPREMPGPTRSSERV